MKSRHPLTKEIYALHDIQQNIFFVKNADFNITDALISATKSAVPDEAKNQTSIEGILKFLTPGIISAILLKIGGPWAALIGGGIATVFDLNLGTLLSSIKDALSGKKSVTSDDVSEVVTSQVESHIGHPSAAQIISAYTASKVNTDNLKLDDNYQFKKSDIFKNQEELFKQGYTIKKIKKMAAGDRSLFVTIISTIFGFIIKAFLLSCGFAFASYVAKQVMKTNEETSGVQIHKSTQKLFKVSPSYTLESHKTPWITDQPPSQIKDMLLDWMIEIYPKTEDYRSVIGRIQSFNDTVEYIENYNIKNKLNVTYIPKVFTNKKMIVDQFIDDAASKVTGMLKSQ